MKAAILHHYDESPKFGEQPCPEPIAGQECIRVKAAPLKNFDRLTTRSQFYARIKNLPAVIGSDGVGLTSNGKRVYAPGATGMLAKHAIIDPSKAIAIPENVDWETAAALPNAVMGAVLPLVIKGNIQKGDRIIIHGATGFTGQIATQAARYYGAQSIIVTGRDERRLNRLEKWGATEILSLQDSSWTSRIEELQKEKPADIVLDYIWGSPAEALLTSLSKGPTYSTRYIDLGNTAGDRITVPAGLIRSSTIEILGAGVGSYTAEEWGRLSHEFIPEMYALAEKGALEVPIQKERLSAIESLWQTPSEAGTRTVFIMD